MLNFTAHFFAQNCIHYIFVVCVLVVDAWGKVPSAFFDGNFYELGGFEECLSIKRDNQPYETKYCLGVIIIKEDEKKLFQLIDALKNRIIPNIWQQSNDGEKGIKARAMVPE